MDDRTGSARGDERPTHCDTSPPGTASPKGRRSGKCSLPFDFVAQRTESSRRWISAPSGVVRPSKRPHGTKPRISAGTARRAER
jgi:hypothetical protein